MMRNKVYTLLGLIISIFLINPAWADDAGLHVVPVPMAALQGIEDLEFCGEPVPLHEQEVRERLEKELLLSVWDRPQVIL